MELGWSVCAGGGVGGVWEGAVNSNSVIESSVWQILKL